MPEGSDPGPGRGGLVLESIPRPILESAEAQESALKNPSAEKGAPRAFLEPSDTVG